MEADMIKENSHIKQHLAPLEDEPACFESIGAYLFQHYANNHNNRH
jgi:hypothetical protein